MSTIAERLEIEWVRWCEPRDVQRLADRTVDWVNGRCTDEDFTTSPGTRADLGLVARGEARARDR